VIDELNASSRALLDAARPGLGPDAAALARVRARVAATVAAPAAGASALAIKLSIVAIVAAVATGAVVHLRSDADAPTAPAAVSPTPGPAVLPPAPALQLNAPSPAPPLPPAPAALPQLTAPSPALQLTAPSPAREPALASQAQQPKPVAKRAPHATLAREVDLLDHAMTSLRGGDLAATLATIRLYQSEAGDRGQLAEDAAAIEVEALCASHDEASIAKLATYDQRWPRSAQRSRLADACR